MTATDSKLPQEDGQELPDAVQEVLARHDEDKARILKAVPDFVTAEKIAAEYLTKYPDDTCRAKMNSMGDVDLVIFTGDLRRIRVIYGLLRRRGYPRSRPAYQNPDGGLLYSFGPISVWLDALEKPDAVCHRVQIGTREMPIYGWECNGRRVHPDTINIEEENNGNNHQKIKNRPGRSG